MFTQFYDIAVSNGSDGDTGITGGGGRLTGTDSMYLSYDGVDSVEVLPADYANIAQLQDTGLPKAVGEVHSLVGQEGMGIATFRALLPVAEGELVSVSPDPATTIIGYAQGSTWTITIGTRVYELSISPGEFAGGPLPATGYVRRLQ